MVAKAAGIALGIGLLGTGGIAVTKPHWLGMDYMPKWHPLSNDHGYDNSSYGTGKFGKKHGRYLVGVTNKNGKTDETNQSWWEWAYRRLQANNPGTNSKFGSVDKPYHALEASALNKVCDEAYKQEDSGFQTKSSSTQFTKEEVWKYCSVGGAKPQTISEFNTNKSENEQEKYSDNNAIGNMSDQKSKLLSINSEDNKWIWDLKDKEFKSTNITGDSYFTTEKNKPETERKTIKDICKGAYEKPENSAGTGEKKIEKTDVAKYCSLEQISSS